MRHLRWSRESVSLPALPDAPPGSPEFRAGALQVIVSPVLFPYTPAPARPAVPVGDGRAGAGMRRRDMASGTLGMCRHAGLLPPGLLGIRVVLTRVSWGL